MNDTSDAAIGPPNYEDLVRCIHERFDSLSKTNQRIAEYLLQHPNEAAIRSVNILAKSCGVHAATIVRFAQTFGYSGFRQLQEVFGRRIITAAPGFEARAARLKTELQEQPVEGILGHLHDIALRDVAAIEDLVDTIPADQMQKAVSLLNRARTIYLLAQLRAQPIALLMQYLLTMIGRPCIMLDAPGGLATHMARQISTEDALFVASFRFYATEVVNITEEVSARKVPIVAFSDSTLSPLAKNADVLFSMPEHDYTFSRSLAAPMCLAQALIIGLAARQSGDDGNAVRIPVATADQSEQDG
ncbi:MAG: MurR/RpiR family transcriptional regulator [Stappiaceae bacterium]